MFEKRTRLIWDLDDRAIVGIELCDCVNPNRFFEAASTRYDFSNIDNSFGPPNYTMIQRMFNENNNDLLPDVRKVKRRKILDDDVDNIIMSNESKKRTRLSPLIDSPDDTVKLSKRLCKQTKSESTKSTKTGTKRELKKAPAAGIKASKKICNKNSLEKTSYFNDEAIESGDEAGLFGDDDEDECDEEDSEDRQGLYGLGDDFDVDIKVKNNYFGPVLEKIKSVLNISCTTSEFNHNFCRTSSQLVKTFQILLEYYISKEAPQKICGFDCFSKLNHIPDRDCREMRNEIPPCESKNKYKTLHVYTF